MRGKSRGRGTGKSLESSREKGGSRSPHLPVRHSFAFEFAVGVGAQSRQLLLTSKSPVPLLATVVVHGEVGGKAQGVCREDRQRHKTGT